MHWRKSMTKTLLIMQGAVKRSMSNKLQGGRYANSDLTGVGWVTNVARTQDTMEIARHSLALIFASSVTMPMVRTFTSDEHTHELIREVSTFCSLQPRPPS